VVVAVLLVLMAMVVMVATTLNLRRPQAQPQGLTQVLGGVCQEAAAVVHLTMVPALGLEAAEGVVEPAAHVCLAMQREVLGLSV
jgi:hypothetical protein